MNNKFEALKAEDSSGSGEEENENKQEPESPPRPPPKPGPGEHPLQFNYGFWYSRKSQGNKSASYDANLKLIGTFASVEQFWRHYCYIARPSDLTGHTDYHLFKEGIRPMWEDSANKSGGKWIIRLKKGLASRCWENLILAMLGEQFMVGEEICGAVISIRYAEDILSLWNRTANDHTTTSRIRDTLKRVLNLPPNTIMEYKTHNDSLKALVEGSYKIAVLYDLTDQDLDFRSIFENLFLVPQSKGAEPQPQVQTGTIPVLEIQMCL